MKIYPILLVILFLSCKKKETVSPKDVYTIAIQDKTTPAGDSLFFSYDYWFYFPETPVNQIHMTSLNSKYTQNGYVSDSLHLTNKAYTMGHLTDTDYQFNKGDLPRFVYRVCHYVKLKDQKIWTVSEKGSKVIVIKKNGEPIFTDNGTGERSSNMELQ